jgi:alkaline phosphatase
MLVSLLYCARHYAVHRDAERFHNVIVLIPDGCGVGHMTIARWFKGAPLTQDSMDVSLVRTFSANSMIAGSASTATAFATGYKTREEESSKARCLSIRPDSLFLPDAQELPPSEKWRPVATVLEGARLAGKAVGLVATSRISHATPAAYASHWHSRDDESILMEQMVHQSMDVVFGGVLRYLVGIDTKIPGTMYKGVRRDGENLVEILKSFGYKVITTKDELNALDLHASKIWGMFAASHMLYDIDRQYRAPDEPSLAEMTKKAIEILSQNPEGFFLMVEGSQVDWASHDNDPVGVVTEYIAFDQAVRVALDFTRSHPEQRTLVLIFPDHDTGGMLVGRGDINSYTFKPQDMNNLLKNARMSADGVEWLIWNNVRNAGPRADSIKRIMGQYYAITDLTDEETASIITELADTLYVNLREVIGPMLSKRAGIGWTTFDHTGNDVPMFSYGLSRAPGTIDNTEIAHLCAQALGFDLRMVTEQLFADASALFKDATLTIDTAGVTMSNGYLLVEKNAKRALFPFFKNIMIMNQDTISLEGITVYSLSAQKVFLPRQAKAIFEAL